MADDPPDLSAFWLYPDWDGPLKEPFWMRPPKLPPADVQVQTGFGAGGGGGAWTIGFGPTCPGGAGGGGISRSMVVRGFD